MDLSSFDLRVTWITVELLLPEMSCCEIWL